MLPRLLGVLALVGGTAWLAKVVVVWANDGANTTEGVAGALFLVGLAAIAGAAVTRAWYLPRSPKILWRVLSAAGALVALLAAVNLPILLAWTVIGRTWFAEEAGIVLVAVLAVLVGARWIRRGIPHAAAQAPNG